MIGLGVKVKRHSIISLSVLIAVDFHGPARNVWTYKLIAFFAKGLKCCSNFFKLHEHAGLIFLYILRKKNICHVK